MIEKLSATRRTWRHQLWILPAALGAAVICFLCWGAWIYGYDPHWLSRGHGWWLTALQPGQNWTLVITLALLLAALACYWLPRRRQRLPIGLLTVVIMGVLTAALGTASLVPCRGGMSTAGVSFWVLQLYVGQPSPPYAPGAAVCAGQPPLALQLGQGIGLGATLIGAVAVASVLWRQPAERLRSRFAKKVTLFTGLDPLTLPLLTRLSDPAGERNVIVIEPDVKHPLLDEARSAGARVVIGHPASRRLLKPMIATWRGCALDHLYALRAEVPENELVLDAVREILGRFPPGTERHPHLVARIDDPRRANHWRGSHGGTSAVFEDALSPVETTAYSLIDAILRTSVRQLIVCGDGSLTLAVLVELDRRGWEQRELLAAAALGREAAQSAAGCYDLPRPPEALSVSSVMLIDPRAADTRREFLASTPRAVPESAVTACLEHWEHKLLTLLDEMPPALVQASAVIIVDSFSDASVHRAGRVARLHPDTWVYIQTPSGDGVGEAVFNRLRLFQSGLLVGGTIPEDTWMRVARHWHECFRLQDPLPPDHPKAAARRPWPDLSDYLRNDNLLQVRSILSEVAALGRQWVPVRTVPNGSFIELSQRELEAVAMAEHTRWYQRRLAAKGPSLASTGSLVMPWAELPADERGRRREQVRSQIAQLEDAGFMPVIQVGGPPGAASFERLGTVHARQLHARYAWLRRPGEELYGEAGDWRVIDDYGHERTVGDAEFRVAHTHLGGRRWRRTGTFRAWQVGEPVVLRTREGTTRATPGDWVVEGAHGERWPVSDEQFSRTYRRVAGDPARPGSAGQATATAAASSSTPPASSS